MLWAFKEQMTTKVGSFDGDDWINDNKNDMARICSIICGIDGKMNKFIHQISGYMWGHQVESSRMS